MLLHTTQGTLSLTAPLSAPLSLPSQENGEKAHIVTTAKLKTREPLQFHVKGKTVYVSAAFSNLSS